MDLNVQDWKAFNIQRTPEQAGLFEIENCKCGSAGELDDGLDINYIGAKKSDNGVMRSVSLDGNTNLVSKGHGIMFICDGEGSVGYTNYMDKDFIGSTTTSIGYDEALTETNAMFLVTVLDNEKFKYSYGRKYRKNLINAEIYLPVQHNADGSIFIDNAKKYSDDGYVPDWQFMEDYIKSLHHKPLTTKNKSGQAPALNVQDWGEFSIDNLFTTIEKGKCGDASSLVDGDDINYIGAKYNDNGVMKSCSKNENATFISSGNCVAMIGQGQGSAGYAIYLDTDFIGATSLNLGYADWINPYTAHFVTTILCKEYDKYSFGRSWTGDRLKNTIIKLPKKTTHTGEVVPDWQFMEDYIKSLPYGDRLGV